MKIFISYSRKQQRLAESLSGRLLGEKHKTFFDVTSLAAGEGYDAKIRRAIKSANLFIFLISPDSIRKESYAQTELSIAKARWPSASGHVLPVVVQPTPLDQVPAYLTTVTVLDPPGNLEAAILDEVSKIADRRRLSRRKIYLGGAGTAVIAALAYFLASGSHEVACQLNAELRRTDGSSIPPSMMLDVSYAGRADTLILSPDAMAMINVGPLKKSDERWTVALRNPDGSVVGTEIVQGCSASAQEKRIGESFKLILSPRR